MKPFAPRGATLLVTAAVSPPTAAQAPVTTGKAPTGQYRVVNAGSVTVFLGVDRVQATALANAATISTTGNAIVLLPGAIEILRFSDSDGVAAPEMYFSAATASGTAAVYITPGEGI